MTQPHGCDSSLLAKNINPHLRAEILLVLQPAKVSHAELTQVSNQSGELHTRIYPVNPKFMAADLVAIELNDSPLSILMFLEHQNSKPHTSFRFARAYVIDILWHIPHQQRSK